MRDIAMLLLFVALWLLVNVAVLLAKTVAYVQGEREPRVYREVREIVEAMG